MSSSKREAARAFFGSKKPWSVQKDLILSRYLEAYLNKIVWHMEEQRRWRGDIPPVLIVDAFAGRGWFDDGAHGSPLHIIESADSVARGKYRLLLGNEDPEQHAEVERLVRDYDHVVAYNEEASTLLTLVSKYVGERALFVFLDPFGIQGYPFYLINTLGTRNYQGLSTEVLINFNVKDFHRKSARDSILKKGIESLDANTLSKIDNLDVALGGDWWRKFQYIPDLSAEERSRRVVEGYVERLKNAGFQYVGRCPVREKDEAIPKYRLIHGSRHIDALVLMNETMGNVIGGQLHERNVKLNYPLFGDQTGKAEFQNWERGRYQAKKELFGIVLDEVIAQPGRRRIEIWHSIIQTHFLQFFHKEYTDVVARLRKAGRIRSERDDGKPGLNNDSRLYPGT
jgi:three-Cys-motif partner protein